MEFEPLTESVIGAAIEVHRIMGPGLLESIYQECMEEEMRLRGVAFQAQVPVPLQYKGKALADPLKMDL
jgi:GxxExxY protein